VSEDCRLGLRLRVTRRRLLKSCRLPLILLGRKVKASRRSANKVTLLSNLLQFLIEQRVPVGLVFLELEVEERRQFFVLKMQFNLSFFQLSLLLHTLDLFLLKLL